MTINRNTFYGARWVPASATHPQGAFLNRTGPSAQDGSYLDETWMNDISAFNEALINAAGITISGSADIVGGGTGSGNDSQYMQGLVEQASGRSYNYDSSGGPTVYTLSIRSAQYAPASYFDGMIVEFTPNVTNTGTASVNVEGLGIVQVDNTASGGELDSTIVTQLRYNSISGSFFIRHGAETGAGTDVTTDQQNGGIIDQTFEQINFRNSAQPSGPTANILYSNAGGENRFILKQNGPDTPAFELSDAAGSEMLKVQGASGTTSCNLTGGTFFQGPAGTDRVLDTDDFPSDNNPSGFLRVSGNITFQWFLTANIAPLSNTTFSWPEGNFLSVFNAQVSATSAAAAGGGAVISLLTTSVTIANNTSTTQQFYVLGLGTSVFT